MWEDILMAAIAAAPDYKGTEPGIRQSKEPRPPWSTEEVEPMDQDL